MAETLPEGTVTVLFTDVEGSTGLTTSRGDEAARDVLRAHEELVRQQVQEHDGREVKAMGDGFMVAFGSARKAVACAVGIQRALAEWNAFLPAHPEPVEGRAERQDPAHPSRASGRAGGGAGGSPEAIRVRMGLNTGEVVRERDDLFGETVNAAARIAAKAKGGQILVSEMVKGLMGRAQDVQVVDRGRFRLKGFPERWHLFEVVWQEEPSATAAPLLVERTPFVGREAERAELRRCLDQVAGGHGALVMIGGEPGVGKTRLAEELMAEARQRGMTALIGHCYEMEGAPPYIPVVETLEAAARTVSPEAFRIALGDAAGEVARILPELRRMFPDIPPPLELPPEQERRYLFNSVREFVERAGRAQPLLLVLDDLHWADDSTMLLVQHLAQQLHEMPVMIVGTYRDVELDVARPLAKTLEELLRQRLAHRMSLKRLTQDGVRAILRALGGAEPPASLAEVVFSETEGNPFFVEELFKHLAEEGKLFDDQGRWCSDLAVGELDVPEGVRLVVARRLERVSEECRRALTRAAVIGRDFAFSLLEALSDIDAGALLDAVDEGERAQLIFSTAEGPETRFTFAHELIRQTLLLSVSAARRQRLHLHAAEVIEESLGRAQQEPVGDLAYHLHEAGASADPHRTARYFSLVGDRALSAAAFEDALRQYEKALDVQPDDDRRGRADLLFKRGMALRSLGRWDDALTDWRESLRLHESAGNIEAAGRIYATITRQLLWGLRYLEALEISQRGLMTIGRRETPERSILLSAGGVALSLAGFHDAAERMMTRALALARKIGDQDLLGRVLGYTAVHHFCYGQMREEVNTGVQAIDLLRSAGDLWDLADALWVTQTALIARGRLDEAGRIGEELEPLAARLGHVGAQQFADRQRAFRELLNTADLDRYEEFARADLDFCISSLPSQETSYTFLGLIDFWKGRWPQALYNLEQGARRELPGINAGMLWASYFLASAYANPEVEPSLLLRRRRGDVEVSLPLRRLLSLVVGLIKAARFSGLGLRMLLGMVRELRRTKVEEFLPRAGRANTLGSWALLLSVVEGLVIGGQPQKAARLYPLVLEAIEMTGSLVRVFEPRLLQTVAGIAAAAGQQWDRAEAHYQTALRQAEELPHKIEQPEVRRWYARMLIDRDAPGDRDKACELLTEAIAMYRRIGMPKHVEIAEAMLREV